MTTDLYFLIVRKTKDYHSMEMDRNQTIDKKFPDTICAACYRDDFVCNERRHIVTRGRAVQAWLYDFVRKQPFFLQCKWTKTASFSVVAEHISCRLLVKTKEQKN